jgi:hypothetical protein
VEKLHNEELHDLYSSPNIVRMMKSRTMRWAGYVARIGERRCVYVVFVGNPEGDPGVGGRIILRFIVRKWDLGVWTGSSWLRIETGGKQL